MSKADWSWLQVDQVAMASAERARFELDKGLKAIDERLDVELTDDDGTRTVVLTAVAAGRCRPAHAVARP